MKLEAVFFVVGLTALSYIRCDDPHLQELINTVVNDADTNNDGIITKKEASRELMERFDHDGDYRLTRDDFVEAWSAKYGDSKETSEAFFDALDVLPSYGVLDFFDLIVHLGKIDSNGDNVITTDEFKEWMYKHHPNASSKS